MNTLSKKYTSRFFKSDEDYDSFRQYWSSLVNSDCKNKLKAVHYLAYLILCGKNWHKDFQPITRQIKLDNGGESEILNAYATFNYIYSEDYIMEYFAGYVTHDMLVEARKLIQQPLIRCSQYMNNEPYIDEAV